MTRHIPKGTSKFEAKVIVQGDLIANILDECLQRLENDMNKQGLWLDTDGHEKVADLLYCVLREYTIEKPKGD